MIATIFMNGAHAGFKPLLNDLKSEYALGADKYPKTIEDALQVLTQYTEQQLYKAIKNRSRKKRKGEQELGAASFAQMSKNQLRKKGLCFKCGKKWSPDHECQEDDNDDNDTDPQQHTQVQANYRSWFHHE